MIFVAGLLIFVFFGIFWTAFGHSFAEIFNRPFYFARSFGGPNFGPLSVLGAKF